MDEYCVNRNAQSGSNDHEVHNLDEGTNCLPKPENRVGLGKHSNCWGAVAKAKEIYDDVNGCAYCAPECHTT